MTEMSDEELDRAADMLRAVGAQDGEVLIPWAALPEFMKERFRDLVRGNAGSAVD